MSEEKNQNEIEEVTNEDEHKDVEHYCYLCRRPESAAGKMLELPNNIFICTDCMQRTLNSMANGQFGFIDARNMDLDSMDITKMMIFTISLMTTMNVEKRNMKKCNYSVSLRVLCDTGKHTCITQKFRYSRMPRHSCCEMRVMQLHDILLLRISAILSHLNIFYSLVMYLTILANLILQF